MYAIVRRYLLPAMLLHAVSVSVSAAGDHAHHDVTPGVSRGGHDHGQSMNNHLHRKGEWMATWRYMRMDMSGNRDGTTDVAAQTIAVSAPNPFLGQPGQPPTLRIVPDSMSMEMHMLGIMYGLTDDVTLMAMFGYVKKEMSHTTFAGGGGTTVLGRFTTRSEGLGDTRLNALFRIHDDAVHHLQARVGLGLPTGSVTETGQILAPTGARPVVRLPYPMQTGSGTLDLLGGISYSGDHGPLSWGVEYQGVFRTGRNEGYRLGDQHRVEARLGRMFTPNVGLLVSGDWFRQGNIRGRDPAIAGPVQTADPARQGRSELALGLGLHLVGTEGALRGHRLAVEYRQPVYQDLDGPQLKTEDTLNLFWQYFW